MKGITPVIAVILLLLVTISITGVASLFLGRTLETAAESGDGQLDQFGSQLGTDFRIDGSSWNQVYVRNRGTVDLNTGALAFYVNNVLMASDSIIIGPGEVGTVTLDDSELALLLNISSIRATSARSSSNRNVDFYEKQKIGYWKLDEGAGAEAVDSSENRNNASFAGNPVWTAGKSGSALSLDGVDDYIQADIAGSPVLNSFTISAWFNATGDGGTVASIRAFTGGSDVAGSGIAVDINGVLKGRVADGSTDLLTLSAGSGYIDNQWHHLALTFDGSNREARLFLDGVEVASGTATSGITGVTDFARGGVGTGLHWGHFDGAIDEIMILDVARPMS